jgi:murein DD-endopeptidase MepM/ murein hydrolase activator NlpD
VSRRHRQLALVAALCLLATTPAPAVPPPKSAGLRARLQSLWERIRSQRQKIENTTGKEHELADQVNQSQIRLEHSQNELRQAKERVKAAQADVDAATKRLYAAHQRVRLHSRRLGRRIAHSYTEGTVSYADVLLGAATIADFLDRQYLIERMLDQDRAVLRELRQAQRDVENERANLIRRRKLLAAAQAEIATRVGAVQEQLKAHAKLLADVQNQKELQEQELDELERDSSWVQQQIQAAERRRATFGYGRGRFRLRWSGTFSRPVNGPVTSGFGYRLHPILHTYRMHTGIDFGAPVGAPIFAAAAGEIFTAGWCRGYGRCIIILHGDGISTLYGHCSAVLVQSGQIVRRGQLIGLVGSTGLSTGPHLHFEVRRNGVPVNPF